MLRLVSRNGGDELPVTLSDMAQHLKREDTVEDDEYIEACLLAAIDWAEQFTGLIMIDSTFDLFVDAFPTDQPIYLGRGPLLELQSVNYRNTAGADITLGSAGYLVDEAGGSIYLPVGIPWPSTDGGFNAVRIRFRAGFIDMTGSPASDGDVPATIKRAILLVAAKFYANREDDPKSVNASRVPYGAEELLRMWRIIDSLA